MENSNKVGAWVVERGGSKEEVSPLAERIPQPKENSLRRERGARESWISHENHRPTITTGNENVIYPNNSRISATPPHCQSLCLGDFTLSLIAGSPLNQSIWSLHNAINPRAF